MDAIDPVDILALRFYDAAADPDLFEPLMADIGAQFGCTGGTFMVWDNVIGDFLLNGSAGIDPESERLYAEHYRAIDPIQALMIGQPVAKVVRCHEHFDDAFVSRSEIYADYLIPIGARYMAMSRLTPDREVSAYLNFGRTARMGPVDDAMASMIARLVPHASRAAKLRQRIMQLERAAQRAEAALDLVDWGIVILTAGGAIVTVNAAAQALLREGDGLFIVHGQLTASTSRDQALLGALLHATAQGGRAGAGEIGGALAIGRPSGRRPLNLLAVPLPQGMTESLDAHGGSIMVTITDPGRAAATPASVLSSLYGLSAREAQIAVALAEGLSIAQIADTQQRSQETIRGQVKAVLSKTGSARQSDLVRTVLSLPRVSTD